MGGSTPQALLDRLHKWTEWEFNMLEFRDMATSDILVEFGKELFAHYGLIEHFNICEERLSNFLRLLSSQYNDENPYHTGLHAVDAAINVHYLLQSGFVRFFTKLDLLVLFVSALGHDTGHFALNNAFLLNSNHEVVQKHGSTSALEHFHLSKLMEVITDDKCRFVDALSPSDHAEFDILVGEMVLATDMSRHKEYMSKFEEWCTSAKSEFGGTDQVAATSSDGYFSWVEAKRSSLSYEERKLFMTVVVKFADLANVVKPVAQSEAWAELIMVEFSAQREREIALALPLTQPANIPNREWKVAKHQNGFLKFVVEPTMVLIMDLASKEKRDTVLSHAKNNGEIWSQRVIDLDPENASNVCRARFGC